METLYLYVKDGSRIHFDAVVLQDIFCQTLFISIFNVHELFQGLFVICPLFQSGHQGQVCRPVLGSDLLCYPLSQKRIAVHQEPSLGNTIGLVIKLLRHHLVEIFKLLIL